MVKAAAAALDLVVTIDPSRAAAAVTAARLEGVVPALWDAAAAITAAICGRWSPAAPEQREGRPPSVAEQPAPPPQADPTRQQSPHPSAPIQQPNDAQPSPQPPPEVNEGSFPTTSEPAAVEDARASSAPPRPTDPLQVQTPALEVAPPPLLEFESVLVLQVVAGGGATAEAARIPRHDICAALRTADDFATLVIAEGPPPPPQQPRASPPQAAAADAAPPADSQAARGAEPSRAAPAAVAQQKRGPPALILLGDVATVTCESRLPASVHSRGADEDGGPCMASSAAAAAARKRRAAARAAGVAASEVAASAPAASLRVRVQRAVAAGASALFIATSSPGLPSVDSEEPAVYSGSSDSGGGEMRVPSFIVLLQDVGKLLGLGRVRVCLRPPGQRLHAAGDGTTDARHAIGLPSPRSGGGGIKSNEWLHRPWPSPPQKKGSLHSLQASTTPGAAAPSTPPRTVGEVHEELAAKWAAWLRRTDGTQPAASPEAKAVSGAGPATGA